MTVLSFSAQECLYSYKWSGQEERAKSWCTSLRHQELVAIDIELWLIFMQFPNENVDAAKNRQSNFTPEKKQTGLHRNRDGIVELELEAGRLQ